MSVGRKADHLRICTEMAVEFRDKSTCLEDVHLLHDALAEGSLDEISTETRFMGRRLAAPLMISAMSGGLAAAQALNRDLAKAAQELGIGLGLGSQRPCSTTLPRSILTPSAASPGHPHPRQYRSPAGRRRRTGRIEKLVTSIDADGLAIHLNPARNSPGGGRQAFPRRGKDPQALTKRMPGRVVVKETGCGISRETALRIKAAGVKTLDIAGAGGTSWTRVENLRKGADPSRRTWLDEWASPPPPRSWRLGSRLGARGLRGLRTGLDAAKCIALGATSAASPCRCYAPTRPADTRRALFPSTSDHGPQSRHAPRRSQKT